ncbi:unnamed protein product [Arabis nemorensis]|uniref:RNase H type-1 domain-containing protein n=1 Tax=Arabis nemorensis TaxID=586526 RepID=A0A565BFQ1_9BRAS|nr:unnamed protein product [Arabis nemorensis]
MVDSISSITTYIQDVAKGKGHSKSLILEGLKIIHIEKGILRCKLVITDRVSDGVWHGRAIASVIDMIRAAVVYSAGNGLHVSLDFNTSFYSTAKIQEEVEIEGRVVASKRGLKGAVVEIRREGNGEVIATKDNYPKFEGRQTAEETECTAFLWAIQSAWSLGYRKVEFEGDDLNINRIINGNITNLKLQHYINAIKNWKHSFFFLKVSYRNRTANECADRLPKSSIVCHHS